ncbi:hypothetical protein ACFX2B_039780 [Malus domestica]
MGTIALQMEIGELYSDTLFHCFKFLINGEVKTVLEDTDPFKGEEKESQSPAVEKAKPSRLVKIMSSKTPKSKKVVLNRSLKDQREPDEKAMEQIQNAFEALVTSYTKPLHRINQSIPGSNLIVSTNLQRNDVHQGNGMLKAFVLETKNHEFESFTNLEKAMLTEEESNSKPPRVSVFQRLGKIANSQPKKSHESKKWRVKSQKVKINQDKNYDVEEEQDVVQVSMIGSKERGKEFDNEPIERARQFPTYFPVKKKNGQSRVCASFRTHNNAPPLLSEAYEMDEESSTEEEVHSIAQVNCITIEDEKDENGDNSTEFIDNAQPAPPQIEDGGQATVDELREINLGTDDEPKPIFVSALLTPEELEDYKSLLQDYRDVFAWGYQDMPGLDTKALRHFRPELEVQIKAEIDKLIDVGFIRGVQYYTWLASIVPVKKKNGQISVCIDFRDLNDACPKDEFPLPITELLVDATTGFEALSFMDGFSGSYIPKSHDNHFQ